MSAKWWRDVGDVTLSFAGPTPTLLRPAQKYKAGTGLKIICFMP